mmetsp:Transcript_28511/g.73130  ORF Transcript_28511/g.73130 Transcript_28511/m.73130 type:complete len:118 (-) Transcript_28511:710-1063(-)
MALCTPSGVPFLYWVVARRRPFVTTRVPRKRVNVQHSCLHANPPEKNTLSSTKREPLAHKPIDAQRHVYLAFLLRAAFCEGVASTPLPPKGGHTGFAPPSCLPRRSRGRKSLSMPMW